MASPTRFRSCRTTSHAALLVLLVVLALAAPITPASSVPTPDPADAAAGWLAGQLVDGDHFETVFGDTAYPDQGMTIDAVLGFAAAGSADDAATAAVAWLGAPANTSGYLGDGAVESYAGATAKLALLAQVAGADPTAFGEGSLDLITRLQALELADGHFADVSAWGDYSNSIGQSLAIIALTRQPAVDPSSASVDFLLRSQCADGGFDLVLDPAPEACASGVDTTAYAVQALLAAGRAADASVGLDYLADVQESDGGFSTDGSGDPNANSTGLAAQALAAGGRTAAADDARAFLLTLQQGCSALSADRGAIAFDAGGFDPGNSSRATAQALLGLGGIGLEDLTLAGAGAAADTFDCRQATTTTSTTTTAPASTTTTAPSPPAAPVPTTPRYTG